jgi:very-short-patch-repair endonuclease
MSVKSHPSSGRGEVLVAIMNKQADFGILQDQGWYRIPVAKAPKRWPPEWMAFYQTKVFGDEAFAINYYGRVQRIRTVKRRDLFPGDYSAKAGHDYYRIDLDRLLRLSHPIVSKRWRRIVFIPTTWQKLMTADEVNDLFDDSPLEERLWAELKRQGIAAERQWCVRLGNSVYFLDFALFCSRGFLAVETDGDAWHADRERSPADNFRQNALEAAGWHVLRFASRQINEETEGYCITKIAETIDRLGGLTGEGMVSRRFYATVDGVAQQLTLFEEGAEYDPD